MNYSTPICAVGECSVFFGNSAKEGAALFQGERRRLNARCLSYMKRHLRCTFGGHRLVLRERLDFIFRTELSAPTLHTFSTTTTIHTLMYLHAMCHTHSHSHFASFASLPALSMSTYASECIDFAS